LTVGPNAERHRRLGSRRLKRTPRRTGSQQWRRILFRRSSNKRARRGLESKVDHGRDRSTPNSKGRRLVAVEEGLEMEQLSIVRGVG
jgi:hypothetical protein